MVFDLLMGNESSPAAVKHTVAIGIRPLTVGEMKLLFVCLSRLEEFGFRIFSVAANCSLGKAPSMHEDWIHKSTASKHFHFQLLDSLDRQETYTY